MADFSIRIADARLQARLGEVVDPQGRIEAALDALVPLSGRRVTVIGQDELRRARLEARGAQATCAPVPAGASVPAGADVRVAFWPLTAVGGEIGSIRPESVAELASGLAGGGRLLIVEDYGRDDISLLLDDPERERAMVALSHRRGPLLAAGCRVRVLHCWWQWPSLEDAASFLREAFPAGGGRLASGLTRPRISYKVAVYHRDLGAAS